MPVDLHGNTYYTVAERVAIFRQACPAQLGWAITTEITERPDGVRAVATITSPQGVIVATGTAEETKATATRVGGKMVELCETSAVGRALAFYGLAGGMEGTEIASAEEMSGVEYDSMNIETDYLPGILAGIKNEDGAGLRQLWDELDERGKGVIWRLMDSHKKGKFRTLLAATYEAYEIKE